MTFEAFVAGAVSTASTSVPDDQPVSAAHPLLNGVPYFVFRREVHVHERREMGTFFSSPAIADAAAKRLIGLVPEDALVCDPTCGIGDLLLSYAARLELRPTLSGTLEAWGRRLAGFDTRTDLIHLCKARLCLLARARGGFTEDAEPLDAFPLIQGQDMFAPESDAILGRADAILFNPPFGKTVWPQKLGWSSGEINAAAIFLDRLTTRVKASAPISAVLPEVLRCGSRYHHFRALLAERGYSGDFEAHGRFDSWTDVDVFTTLLTRSDASGLLWQSPVETAGPCVGDRFEVRVGTVVPHRDPEDGKPRLYICAKTTPAWSEAFVPQTLRGFHGRAFHPPFVAIRRTSSPSDRNRAVGTIVTGSEPVLVENHLLVAIAEDGTMQACAELLGLLRSDRTNRRLNALMRCRHLTTATVGSLPWDGQ